MLRRTIIGLLAFLAVIAIGLACEMRSPRVVRYQVAMAHWPKGAAPVRLAFLSDTHVAGPDMPPARLAGIVATVNTLAPDCVLLGGDYISEKVFGRHYSDAASVAPFARLRPRIATYAVGGNHDVDAQLSPAAMLKALRKTGAITLDGQAAKCGALTIAGVNFPYPGQWKLHLAAAAAKRLGGPAMLLTHAPDLYFHKSAFGFPLTIAGHTHCGQVALPLYGPVFDAMDGPRSMACGRSDVDGRTLIVGGGLGTSWAPVRLFTRPQILLVTVGPAGQG